MTIGHTVTFNDVSDVVVLTHEGSVDRALHSQHLLQRFGGPVQVGVGLPNFVNVHLVILHTMREVLVYNLI